MTTNFLQRREMLAAAAAIVLAGCGRKRPRARAVPPGAIVLALGDSLTYGTGATPQTSYPAVLAQLTGWNVLNAGVPGDVSAQALERLPALLEEHKPALVLVGIGGNDFLRRVPADTTRGNVRSICRQSLAADAQVLLIAVPELGLVAAMVGSLGDHAMYAELADELKVPLHAGGWAQVLSDPALRSDQIHANAKGYEQFANRLAVTAQTVGLWSKP